MMAIAALGAATPGIFTLEPMPLTPTIAKQYKILLEHDPNNTLTLETTYSTDQCVQKCIQNSTDAADNNHPHHDKWKLVNLATIHCKIIDTSALLSAFIACLVTQTPEANAVCKAPIEQPALNLPTPMTMLPQMMMFQSLSPEHHTSTQHLANNPTNQPQDMSSQTTTNSMIQMITPTMIATQALPMMMLMTNNLPADMLDQTTDLSHTIATHQSTFSLVINTQEHNMAEMTTMTQPCTCLLLTTTMTLLTKLCHMMIQPKTKGTEPPSPHSQQCPVPVFVPLHLPNLDQHLQKVDNLWNQIQQLCNTMQQLTVAIAAMIDTTDFTPLTPHSAITKTSPSHSKPPTSAPPCVITNPDVPPAQPESCTTDINNPHCESFPNSFSNQKVTATPTPVHSPINNLPVFKLQPYPINLANIQHKAHTSHHFAAAFLQLAKNNYWPP